MNYLISYSSGGLGNRLIPLSCCIELSHKLNREVALFWRSTLRCEIEFSELFKNKISSLDLRVLDPNETLIYGDINAIINDSKINNIDYLLNLSKKCEIKSINRLNEIFQDKKRYIIIYHNTNFLDLKNFNFYLKSLTPIDEIQFFVEKFSHDHKIDKNVIGVHARSTDFINERYENYRNNVKSIVDKNPNVKILFCSDSKSWEEQVKIDFPNNIIFRQKREYVSLDNFEKKNIRHPNEIWINNVKTPKDSVIEALIDIYLLSKTNFLIYNPQSSFAKLVIHLQTD